jgi:hypothetical protein
MMSGQQRKWIWGGLLSLFLVAAGAQADQVSVYEVGGTRGATLWGLGNQPGTAAVLFAFNHVTPVKPDTAANAPKVTLPPPGPRVAFLVTQWGLINNTWVERQWYGDWPMDAKGLGLAGDLSQGTLDTMVQGTVVESSESGTVVHRNIPGRLQVKWLAGSDLANTTTAYNYQTSAYTATLQTVGQGRMATATATLTVPALGAPIPLSGIGALSAITTGALNVTMQ